MSQTQKQTKNTCLKTKKKITQKIYVYIKKWDLEMSRAIQHLEIEEN
jgi:hypothetical protein